MHIGSSVLMLLVMSTRDTQSFSTLTPSILLGHYLPIRRVLREQTGLRNVKYFTVDASADGDVLKIFVSYWTRSRLTLIFLPELDFCCKIYRKKHKMISF